MTAVSAGCGKVIVCADCVTLKFREAESPPPGKGLEAMTRNVPTVVMRLAGTVAVSCVLLEKTVAMAVSLKRTNEVLIKFVPVNVRLNAPPPAVAEVGLMLVRVGSGLLMLKVLVTGLAAAKLALPVWFAVIEQTPTVTSVTDAPVTVQIEVELLV